MVRQEGGANDEGTLNSPGGGGKSTSDPKQSERCFGPVFSEYKIQQNLK